MMEILSISMAVPAPASFRKATHAIKLAMDQVLALILAILRLLLNQFKKFKMQIKC